MEDGNIKNICIFGTGGIGGVYGGVIADKISKVKDRYHKVFYIARGEHLKKIRDKGLTLNLPGENAIICRPEGAEESFNDIPAPDLILLCVKGYDLDSALKDISNNVKKDTVIIPLLNGVDIYDRIRRKLNACIVLPSCVYIGAHIVKPGEVSQDSENALIITGRDPLNPDYDLSELKELFHDINIKCEFLKNSSFAIWEKYMFIASFGLVTAYSGKPFGGVMEDAELKELTKRVICEISAVAHKKGVNLPEDIIDKTLGKGNNFPYDTKTSYQRDVENKKPKTEGDLFGGTIIRLGEDIGVDTKVTKKIYQKILNGLERG